MAGWRTEVLPSASVEHACCQGVLLYLWERGRDTAVSSDVGPINDRLVGLLSYRYTVPWYSSLIRERFRKMGVGSRIHMLRVSMGGNWASRRKSTFLFQGRLQRGDGCNWVRLMDGTTERRAAQNLFGPNRVSCTVIAMV